MGVPLTELLVAKPVAIEDLKGKVLAVDAFNVLKIINDGTEFSIQNDASKGLGLRIMKYRAATIGGELTIGPGDEGGACVTCNFNENNKNSSESQNE